MDAAIVAGHSLAEIVASHPTAEFDARFGGGFMKPDQFVGLVYGSLTKERSVPGP